MMLFQFLLVVTFPTLIFGIQCAVGGKCYQADITKFLVDVPIKTCKDACVYFKCANHITDKKSETYVREGYGCLEDFLNVCNYAPTNIKEDATKNIKNNHYSISNDDLTFRSCSDKDECSTNGLKSWTTDNVKFNIAPVYKEYNGTYGNYYNTPDQKEKVSSKCERKLGCLSGKFYFLKDWYADWQNFNKRGDDKECDGCLQFRCSNDGGNTVIFGSGCWEDFEYACPSIPDDIKDGIKRNINDSFYYGTNYMVISCNTTGDTTYYCRSFFLDYYKKYNPSAEKMFKGNVNKAFDETCFIDFVTTPSPPAFSSTETEAYHGQSNGFKLNIVLLIGLIFIKLL